MKVEVYKKITRGAISRVSKFFKPKEIQVLFEFIETIKQEDINPPLPAEKEEERR